MAVDVLLQAELISKALPLPPEPMVASREILAPPPPEPTPSQSPIRQVVVQVAADWTQRYDGDGIELPDPGVSQGLLDQDGHERSLVGFDLSGLPIDAEIRLVRLRVPWTSWAYANGIGSLALGWHDQDTPPLDWTVGEGAAQLATYDARQAPLTVALDWAASPIEARTFRGLAIGPGDNDAPLYAGLTTAAPVQWGLEIHHTTREGS